MNPLPGIDKLLDQVARTLGEAQLSPELEAQVRQALQSALTRLDLVTREEFDAQTAVLQRTREKVEALERQVTSLENAQDEF